MLDAFIIEELRRREERERARDERPRIELPLHGDDPRAPHTQREVEDLDGDDEPRGVVVVIGS